MAHHIKLLPPPSTFVPTLPIALCQHNRQEVSSSYCQSNPPRHIHHTNLFRTSNSSSFTSSSFLSARSLSKFRQHYQSPSSSHLLPQTPCAAANNETRTSSPPDQQTWSRHYKSYIKRNGRILCSMSYAGYQHGGRGAVFADYDRRRKAGENVGGVVMVSGEKDKVGVEEGIPSMYISRAQIIRENQGKEKGESEGVKQILRRIDGYDPEKQFVVVFSWGGIMGADVVSPSVAPRTVWKMDGGADQQQSL